MIAIDASAVVALLVDESEVGSASRHHYALHDLAAPELLHFEVSSALRRLFQRDRLSSRLAERALHDLELLRISMIPYTDIGQRMWELRDNLSAYDASYVAVAELLEVELLTFDARIRRAPGPRCNFVAN
jgi:predicted nucleic acid-binding protein